MNVVPTRQVTIFCGLREQYAGRVHSQEDAYEICQEYVDSVGLCVTVTRTEFVYANGREPGIIVGLINYPRFPSTPEIIKEHALELARRLKKAFNQNRVTVICSNETIMLGDSK